MSIANADWTQSIKEKDFIFVKHIYKIYWV